MSNNIDDFLFGGEVDMNHESLKVYDKKESKNDGIYRPKLEDAKDKKIGYKSTFRFLPNLFKTETGEIKIGPSAIEKNGHYVNIPSQQSISGTYDCLKRSFGEDCALCNEYYKLSKSKKSIGIID